jgi:hypothetical protein
VPDRSARFLGRSLVLLIAAAALLPAGLTAALPASQAETEEAVPEGYVLTAENDPFELHVDATTLAFKLRDRRSGYLWHSGLDQPLEEDDLNTSWQAFARSGVSIEYLDARGVNRRVSIANSEHTMETEAIENGIAARITFTDYGISLGLRLTLDDYGVRVEVPFEGITEENPEFRLGRIYLYPFLGAARGSSIDGYMLVPDGTGSLILFADSSRADNMFYGRYYGQDLGMLGVEPYDPFIDTPDSISMPVFGMAHTDAESAYLSVVTKGAGYGEVQVHPAAVITNFNFLFHAFVYNEPYFQATNRSGAGVTVLQDQPNAFDVEVQYRFLTGDNANYVGMANALREVLSASGSLTQADFSNPDIPTRVEFLGGDKEPVLFWQQFVTMTTFPQMRDILGQLALPNPDVIVYGWQPYGATSVPPTSLAVEGALGTLDDLRALADDIAAQGGHFSLYLDPQAALWNEPGYNARTDLAMAITNVTIEAFNRSVMHFFTLDALRSRFQSLAASVAGQPNIGLALDGIGYRLFSDHRSRPPFSREAAIAAYRDLLAQAPVPVAFYRPNDYLLGFARAYYDMPLGDNAYVFTSESVPFLPIVLSGSVPYFGEALNFSSNLQEDLLRHVEYGIYPSYFLTQEPTSRMLNTQSSWIYTSSIAQWGESIRSTYAWMNALLGPVRGQRIIAHTMLADGIAATTYADGSQILVNYTDRPFEHRGVRVEPRDAALVEAES